MKIQNTKKNSNLSKKFHFIIKELEEEFKDQFECLGENTEKYNTFSVPIKKELDNGKSVTYKIKFVDCFRFMSYSLSYLVDNLAVDRLLENKLPENIVLKKFEFGNQLDYMRFKDNHMLLKYFQCNLLQEKVFNEELINKLKNTYEFCNRDMVNLFCY